MYKQNKFFIKQVVGLEDLPKSLFGYYNNDEIMITRHQAYFSGRYLVPDGHYSAIAEACIPPVMKSTGVSS